MLKRLLGILVVCTATAAAQTTAIRAGHVIDPATGKAAANQIILVKDGKIAEVGANVAVPAGAAVIDLSKEWVLPGLMDAHTHITMNLPPAGSLPVWESTLARESSGLRALRGAHNGRTMLESGFTVVRDVGNAANYADTDVRVATEKGWVAGVTVVNTGKIIAPLGGQFPGISPEWPGFWQYEYIDADTPDEIRKGIRQNIYYGAKAIKLVADSYAYHYSVEDIRAAADETHRAGMKLAVHVYGGQAARDVILGGADSVEHGFALDDDLLKLMKEKGTVLVGTDFPYEHLKAIGGLLNEDPKTTADKIIDRLRRAHKIGVKMAFGSDVVADLDGKNRGEMTIDYIDVWTAAGVPPAEILKAMTTNAAELLGIAGERGAIKAGQAADIIATPADPLADIQALRKVNFVMKDGAVIKRP
ncbi:MAG TPA: amidohydrolase family protein [Candidatus Acidoferrales bacterium]|nr:amidohydrolase family protein [Candidatus Acidoferrales bacterium]